MLKKSITYTNFDGEEVTEDFYFNVSKTEIVEMEAQVRGGFSAWLQTLIKTEDTKELVAQFKKFILMTHGERSADGNYFTKTDESRAKFESSAAFDKLFWDIFTDEQTAADFIIGVVPRESAEDVAKEIAATKEAVAVTSTPDPGPPPPPTT